MRSNRAHMDETIDWLNDRAFAGWSVETLLHGLVARLLEHDIDLYRVHFGAPILHPLYGVRAFTWFHGKGIEMEVFGHNMTSTSTWAESPLRAFFEAQQAEGRITFLPGSPAPGYPILDRAQAEGATDYLLQICGLKVGEQVELSQRNILAISWICKSPDGFREEDLLLLRRLRGPLALALKHLTQAQVVDDVLDTYLGSYSGKRVLDGQIQRGDGEIIDAVVFYCDLRGSSKLAEHYGIEGFLGVLNEYFEVTAGAVDEHEGEVLRFIGDASLAIFPFDRFKSPREACQAALDAAQRAMAAGRNLNRERVSAGEPPLEFGIGLHPGRVMYGNIGTRKRLEFSVIGAAANEAARIEGQCRELGEPLLVSSQFAAMLPNQWRSLGEFDLRNIGTPMEILAPAA
jgi:adenylate cyclase